jgi:hypothetical protein
VAKARGLDGEAFERIDITWQEGLYEGLEASTLGQGYAQELENWVPESSGGLRARVGWSSASTTSAPGTRRNCGLGYIASPTARILSAFTTTVDTEVQVYSIDKASIASGSWTSRDTITVASGASSHVDFALGLGYAYYTSAAFGAVRRYSGSGSGAAVSGSPAGARTLAFHKSRIFAGGDSTNPTRLWYSDINDGSTWGANNYIEVGKDDGEPIECLEVFQDQLLIGKENSLWVLTGAGSDTFALHYLGSLGCAPGRTIVRTPYGAVIAGKTYVSMFQGADPQPISEPIERSYGMTGSYMSAAYIDKTCYVLDAAASKYWAYNLDTGKWWKESVNGSNRYPNNLMVQANTLYAGPNASTTVALFYRTLPSTTRSKDSNANAANGTADTMTQIFNATTPELWIGGPDAPVTLRNLEMRVRQRGGNAGQTGITITPTVDNTTRDVRVVATERGAGTYKQRQDFGETGYSVQLNFAQTLLAGEAAVCDLEDLGAYIIQGNVR